MSMYEGEIKMHYDGLDPKAKYKVRVVYSPEFARAGGSGVKVKLEGDGQTIHDLMAKPSEMKPVDFDIPASLTADGNLTLRWTRETGLGGNGRGCQGLFRESSAGSSFHPLSARRRNVEVDRFHLRRFGHQVVDGLSITFQFDFHTTSPVNIRRELCTWLSDQVRRSASISPSYMLITFVHHSRVMGSIAKPVRLWENQGSRRTEQNWGQDEAAEMDHPDRRRIHPDRFD